MKNKSKVMKKNLTLLFLILIFGLAANATTYYVSNSGSDNNSGTSTSAPWKTLAKVSSFTGFVAGDAILFNRGEVFYGMLKINNSGSSGKPITYGAYGSGADPIITGFTTVSTWTNLGSNIWESSTAISNLPYTNLVVVNNVNTPMGRIPNTGLYSYQSFTRGTNNTITSSNLTGSTNWTGAELAMYNTTFTIVRNRIISESGGTLTYTPLSTDLGIEFANQGFIIQNDPRTLDVKNEWYYNPSTKKIRVYSSVTPTGIQVSTLDSLIYINGKSYITIDNISLTGANRASIHLAGSSHITVQNCDINFSGRDGIFSTSATASFNTVQNCTINNCNNDGINFYYTATTNSTIRGNTISNCGLQMGMGSNGASGLGGGTYAGIICLGSNSLIELNNINGIGNQALWIFGANSAIQKNFINQAASILHDNGGGIYSWNGGGGTMTNVKILNNIILNCKLDAGIFTDENCNNIEIGGNTVYNCAVSGIYTHNSWNINVHNNTTYNNPQGLYVFDSKTSITNSGNRTYNNILFAKTSTQPCMWLDPVERVVAAMTFDSNYYARPIVQTGIIKTFIRTPTFSATDRTLSDWQSYSGKDSHAHTTPKTVTDTNNLRFEYNATNVNKTISLDANYIDVKNVSYNGTITLAPYTSAVLIKNGAITGNQSPTAKAGSDQTITLPTSTVSLSGSGTDPDGTISAYNWTKISGPSGTITSATSAATTVTALLQGVYQFQLKVTDNAGATGLDTVQVTVNVTSSLLAAVNPANTVNGMNYNYYASGGGWSALPDFNTMTPTSRGVTTTFNISSATQLLTFAFKFAGYINVPSDGTYTFYTTSDDGSNLYIDGVLVVNNDGTHGAIEKSGTIGLKAGKHAISVGYFQQSGGSVLTVSYAGPGISKQIVPASALYIVTGTVALGNNNIQTITSSSQVSIKAYPNPFANYIEINLAGGVAGEYKLMLVDASGQIVWTTNGTKNAGTFQQSINTSALQRGIYFLKVIQKNESSVIKLVK